MKKLQVNKCPDCAQGKMKLIRVYQEGAVCDVDSDGRIIQESESTSSRQLMEEYLECNQCFNKFEVNIKKDKVYLGLPYQYDGDINENFIVELSGYNCETIIGMVHNSTPVKDIDQFVKKACNEAWTRDVIESSFIETFKAQIINIDKSYNFIV